MSVSRQTLGKLFNARSMAIIGGSADPVKLGSWPFVALKNRGYQGKVHVVNPKYTTLFDHPCFPSIADLPDGIEAALIMLPAAAAVAAAEECAKKGIGAVVIGAQGFGETGPEGAVLDRQLSEVAAKYGLAVAGPNSNGIANLSNGLMLSFSPILQRPETIPVGPVTVISQSGAMIGTLLGRLLARQIGIHAVVTCGNQLVLSMEDYLDYFADDPETGVVVLFIEALRRPDDMRAALRRCRAAGKHVVAIKVGYSDAGTRAAASHTGAITGSYETTLALLRREGVVVVEDLETLAASVQLFTQHTWPLADTKPFVVSISGGLAALLSDMMARHGMELPELSKGAAERLGQLSNLSHPINPYDLAGRYPYDFVTNVIEAFTADGFNQLVFGLGLLPEPVLKPLLDALVDARKKLGHLHVYWSSAQEGHTAYMRAAGITVTEDAQSLLSALSIIGRAQNVPAAIATMPSIAVPALLRGATGLLDENQSKAALAELGLGRPGAREIGPQDALPTAAEVPFPWAMKGLSDRIAHKSEHGLVVLGIDRQDDAETARARIMANLRAADPTSDRLLVEEMVSGLEAFLGMTRDPRLGPAIVVGAGGILVELIKDIVTLVPPFSVEEAMEALLATRFGRLMAGWRGKSYDLEAVARAAVTIGALALEAPQIASMDINPLFVQPEGRGVVVGDAKITLGPVQ